MWANAMREILTMIGDATDAASEAIRREAKQKLEIFTGWINGTRPRPSDEERRELVREVTTLYRKAKTHAARYDPENLSDESSERMVDPSAPEARRRRSSASGE